MRRGELRGLGGREVNREDEVSLASVHGRGRRGRLRGRGRDRQDDLHRGFGGDPRSRHTVLRRFILRDHGLRISLTEVEKVKLFFFLRQVGTRQVLLEVRGVPLVRQRAEKLLIGPELHPFRFTRLDRLQEGVGVSVVWGCRVLIARPVIGEVRLKEEDREGPRTASAVQLPPVLDRETSGNIEVVIIENLD
ncbi:hypothetical protein GUJ93_ZPchr0006g43260 [Zizania palustris]|uniref:Uncharacterized protein n=1 Tax=Zizania palustris TaxID=103762 RepID=A0A8J5T045_ZIZPA|nr:hypothetical protein GUJ93_ZPchr0006g43260 [Zizania palustris]